MRFWENVESILAITIGLLSPAFSWESRWIVSLRQCVRPCSGRWSLKPSRPWIFQVCSAPAVTATSAPYKLAAPRTTTASLSSPCLAPREASRAGPVSVCVWWLRRCVPLLCGFNQVEEREREFYDNLCQITLTRRQTHIHKPSPSIYALHSCVQYVHPYLIFNLFFLWMAVIFAFQPSLLLLCTTMCIRHMHGHVHTACAHSLLFVILLFSLYHHSHQPPLCVLSLCNRYRNAYDYDDSSLSPAASFRLCLIPSLLTLRHFCFKHVCFVLCCFIFLNKKSLI